MLSLDQIKLEVMIELGCKGVPSKNIEEAIRLTYEKCTTPISKVVIIGENV